MIFLDTITSSPFNVIFTIVLGIGLAYFYYKKPASSSSGSSGTSTSSLSSSSATSSYSNSRSRFNNTLTRSVATGIGGSVISEELRRTIEQIERQERDMIRQEQDEAYQQSLKADREKQLKREEELRIKEEGEKLEKDRIQRLEQLHNRLLKLRSEIVDNLPAEPPQDQDNIVKLVFKLPDGTRVKRNFHLSDRVKYLYWYVFSLNNAPLQFKMTTNFPKRDLPGRPPQPDDFSDNNTPHDSSSNNEPNSEQTLEEAKLTETQIIFVHDLEA